MIDYQKEYSQLQRIAAELRLRNERLLDRLNVQKVLIEQLREELSRETSNRDNASLEVERLRAEMLDLAEWCEAEEPLSHKKLSYWLRKALENGR